MIALTAAPFLIVLVTTLSSSTPFLPLLIAASL
jgi:hypothetical protein